MSKIKWVEADLNKLTNNINKEPDFIDDVVGFLIEIKILADAPFYSPQKQRKEISKKIGEFIGFNTEVKR